MITEKGAFESGQAPFSLVDWKSKGSQRVCRSTFAGETMACSEGVEAALFLRCLYASFAKGAPVTEEESCSWAQLHAITDCRSLFNHLHREGIPKAPSEKRLAIDLASLRQTLMREARAQWSQRHGEGEPTPEKPCRPPLHWLPTHLQLADIFTKELSATSWWSTIDAGHFDFPWKGYAKSAQNADDFVAV